MSFRVKLDESLSEQLVETLTNAGYDALTVLGQNWGGTKDPELWPRVQQEGVFFITSDKGFGDLRRYPPGTHAGVLLLRPDRESLIDYRSLIEHVIRERDLRQLSRCVTVATHRSIRTRRPDGS